MGGSSKRRKSKAVGSRRRDRRDAAEPRNPLEDVFESGGELFLAVGYTPGGAPFGPRVEIVDGELEFPDDLPVDVDAAVELEGRGLPWDSTPPDHDSPSDGT